MTLKQGRGYQYNCNYHLVFCPKYRNGIFSSKKGRKIMSKLITEVCQEKEIEIINMQVMPDHVHLLVSFKPKRSISTVVKNIKGITSRRFFQYYPERKKKIWGSHLWSPSYYVGTIGDVSAKIVQQYIDDQRKNTKPLP